MDDRQLLELAAKAAGYQVLWNSVMGCFRHANPEGEKYGWEPLTDDGDALRLAVRLRLHLGLEDHAACAWPNGDIAKFCGENISAGDDPCIATRRAIVRAAAAIGKAMP